MITCTGMSFRLMKPFSCVCVFILIFILTVQVSLPEDWNTFLTCMRAQLTEDVVVEWLSHFLEPRENEKPVDLVHR